MDWIYLDNNATTQPLPEVVEAMRQALQEAYANPSSVHQFGQAVRHRIECAREQGAVLSGAGPKEVIFTSGGTESINLAIRGALAQQSRRQLVTTTAEHSAVLRVAEQLAAEGYPVDFVGVDSQGQVDVEAFRSKVTDGTALVSLMHTNNETGVITDLPPLLEWASNRGALVHLDGVQSVGKLPLAIHDLPVHLLSMAGHKFHGPKGVGALYVRRRTRIAPLLLGGSQEQRLRGGTENVAGIVGMGAAAEAAARDLPKTAERVAVLRDRLEQGLLERVQDARVNGGGTARIHNTTNLSFAHLQAEAILILLGDNGICASSGSACSSGSLEPSHVLEAMGVPEAWAHGAIRFSLSRFTTEQEIDKALAVIPGLLERLRRLQTT